MTVLLNVSGEVEKTHSGKGDLQPRALIHTTHIVAGFANSSPRHIFASGWTKAFWKVVLPSPKTEDDDLSSTFTWVDDSEILQIFFIFFVFFMSNALQG